MNREEYSDLFHRTEVNLVAFKQVNDCDEELRKMVEMAVKAEREACEDLHDHEDVMAPIGHSAWGEAYQEGWIDGVKAYQEAIRARGQA